MAKNFLNKFFILIILTGLVIIVSGCNEQTSGVATKATNLRFVCNTYEQEKTEYTLQNEMAALVNSFGIIKVNDKGEILEERQALKLDEKVGVPGWSGSVAADMIIDSISMTGKYNANNKTGNGKFTAEYRMSGSEECGSTNIERTIDGEFEITPTEYSGHSEKGRLTIEFRGSSTHDQVYELKTPDGIREEKVNVDDEDWGGYFIFEEIEN